MTPKDFRKLAGLEEHVAPKNAATPARNEADIVSDYEMVLAGARDQRAANEASLETVLRLAGVDTAVVTEKGPSELLMSAPVGSVRHLGEKKLAYLKISEDGWKGWKILGKASRHPEATPDSEPASAEVRSYFAEGTERFWELAGLGQGPEIAYDQGWDDPGTLEAVKPQQPPGWKKTVVKAPPKPDKSYKFHETGGHEDAYKSLTAALDKHMLPTRKGEDRTCDSKEFMYQGRHVDETGNTAMVHFKHRDTRNHLLLDLNDQQIIIPKSDKPFHRGEFDKVEHSETYERMRLLAGID